MERGKWYQINQEESSMGGLDFIVLDDTNDIDIDPPNSEGKKKCK